MTKIFVVLKSRIIEQYSVNCRFVLGIRNVDRMIHNVDLILFIITLLYFFIVFKTLFEYHLEGSMLFIVIAEGQKSVFFALIEFCEYFRLILLLVIE